MKLRDRSIGVSFVVNCLAAMMILVVQAATPFGAAAEQANSQANRNVQQAVRTYREANEVQILDELRALVAIPNVTADRPNLRRNAEHVRALLAKRGLKVELFDREGANPLVFAERTVPGAIRTLVIYAHYDGQPVEPLADWKVDPWKPTLYSKPIEVGGQPLAWPAAGNRLDPEWRLYGRSAADDKGPIVGILAGIDALIQAGITPTSNLRFVFDGEEEAGSPNLAAYLKEHPEKLRGDLWLVFDGPTNQSRRPQLVYGVRGIVQFEVTVYGAAKPLHSGHYGNFAPNPALALAQLLASMKDTHGKVFIEGFEKSSEPLGEREREAIRKLPDFDRQLREELQFAESEGMPESYWDRLARPSLNIRGMSSGQVGAAATNTIPAKATAAIDIRLVKGNNPAAMVDLVVEHIKKQGYFVTGAEPDAALREKYPRIAKVVRGEGNPAARTPMDNPFAVQVEKAARALTGDALLLVPTMGGTLPLDVLRNPFVIVTTVNHDNNQHAPNENLRIANLWYAIEIFTQLGDDRVTDCTVSYALRFRN